MFNSRMYKKYYPIKSSADIVNMDITDKKKLIKWIYKFKQVMRLAVSDIKSKCYIKCYRII